MSAPPSSGWARLARALLPYLLYLACTLPFAQRAFDIDDPIFLGMARQASVDPLRPMDFTIRWDQKVTHAFACPNPPLPGYWWASWGALFGLSELSLHLAVLPFGFLAIWAMGLLARRFSAPPLWSQLFLAVSPPLVVLSSTIMPDVILVGLVGVGVALGLRAVDEGRTRDGVLAGVALGGALLARYTAASVLLLLLVYPWLTRRPSRRVLLPVGVALVPPLVWNVLSYATEGTPHFFAAMGVASSGASAYKLAVHVLGMLLVVGGAVMVPPAAVVGLLRERALRRLAWIIGLVLAFTTGLSYAIGEMESPYSMVLYPLFFVSGLLMLVYLARIVRDGLRALPSRTGPAVEALWLCAWGAGMAVAPLLYVHVAVKYVLPALPPLLILILRGSGPRTELGRGVALACTALVSVLVAVGDYQRAEVVRDVARDIAAPVRAQGRVLWFRPEWGYLEYLSRLGAKPLHHGAEVRKGELLLVTSVTPTSRLPRIAVGKMREIERRSYETRFAMTSMHPSSNAGFHSSFWGWFPFAPGVVPIELEEVRLYEATEAFTMVPDEP